jgi:hypothetical protein
MTSIVGICRMALDLLGDYAIADLSDNTKQARLCDRNYPVMRDAVLRAHPWNCAMTRARLPLMADAPAFGFARQYQLPSDCLRLLPVTQEGYYDAPTVAHRVEGRRVLTDASAPLDILYVRRLTDPSDFDPLLTDAIAARLAWQIAYNLTGSRSMAADARQVYFDKLGEARVIDGVEGTISPVENSSWIEARF